MMELSLERQWRLCVQKERRIGSEESREHGKRLIILAKNCTWMFDAEAVTIKYLLIAPSDVSLCLRLAVLLCYSCSKAINSFFPLSLTDA